jgi:hypothetical protein
MSFAFLSDIVATTTRAPDEEWLVVYSQLVTDVSSVKCEQLGYLLSTILGKKEKLSYITSYDSI